MRKSITIKVYGRFTDWNIKNLLYAVDEREYKIANNKIINSVKKGNYHILSPKK